MLIVKMSAEPLLFIEKKLEKQPATVNVKMVPLIAVGFPVFKVICLVNTFIEDISLLPLGHVTAIPITRSVTSFSVRVLLEIAVVEVLVIDEQVLDVEVVEL